MSEVSEVSEAEVQTQVHILTPEEAAEALAELTSGRPKATGRPKSKQRKEYVIHQLRSGAVDQVDKNWLLVQLVIMYESKGMRAGDKLRALELIARVSGYNGQGGNPEGEKEAFQDLLRDMDEAGEVSESGDGDDTETDGGLSA